MNPNPLLKSIAVAALFAAGGVSHGAITVYTTQSSFLAAVSSPGVDTFSNISTTAPTPSPLTRAAGAYGYTASSTTSFFGAAPGGDVALSTNNSADVITFGSFTGGVRAGGANFFDTEIDGAYMPGDIVVTATDASGAVSTQTITGATTSSFRGFVSTVALTSITVTAIQPATAFVYPTVDNLTLAVPVPEAQTYALMIAGLGVIGLVARRRRRG